VGWNREVADVELLVNQVGYSADAHKRVVLQCRHRPVEEPRRFSVIQEGTGQVLHAGGWENFGRVHPESEDDWGFWYWRGDFTDLERGNRVLIETEMNGETVRSPVFEIGRDILWKRLAPLLVEYFRRSRNTRSYGILEDEERFYDVRGGWFELGDHGGTLMRDAWKVLWALAQSRERDPFLDAAGEELRYGSGWWKQIMIHYPTSGRVISGMGGWLADEERISWYEYPAGECQHEKLMSLALYMIMFRQLHDSGCLKRAEKLWNTYRDWITTDRIFSVYHRSRSEAGGSEVDSRWSWQEPGRNFALVDDAAFLFGDVEMHRELKRRVYLEHAEQLIDALLAEAQDDDVRWLQWNNAFDHLHVTSLAYFADHAPENPRSQAIRAELKSFYDVLTRNAEAESPFGIASKNFAGCEAWRPDGRLSDVASGLLDRRSDARGLNQELALEAWQALWVERVLVSPKYRRFAQAHIDWILGLNPRGVCMVKGVGSVVPPMQPADVFDGAVCHGLISDGHRGRPWLGTWDDDEADTIAGHPCWAQGRARLGTAASLLMALSMT